MFDSSGFNDRAYLAVGEIGSSRWEKMMGMRRWWSRLGFPSRSKNRIRVFIRPVLLNCEICLEERWFDSIRIIREIRSDRRLQVKVAGTTTKANCFCISNIDLSIISSMSKHQHRLLFRHIEWSMGKHEETREQWWHSANETIYIYPGDWIRSPDTDCIRP